MSSSRRPKRGVLDYFLGARAKQDLVVIERDAQEGLRRAIVMGSAAVLITADELIPDELLAEAKAKEISILGPDSFGVAAPHEGINHSLSLSPILAGRVAFVTQSGSLGAAILDWAHEHQVGFSAFVALGKSQDIGFADCIDYLSEDPRTQSILVYLETVHDASRFLSAARECALRKPIIVLKAGRGDGKKDSVFDAAFRRCGVLRVSRMADLFYMAELLERQTRPKGPKLAIVTNANGPALLAADALRLAGGEMHSLTDLGGSAGSEEYRSTLQTLCADAECHGILTILTPQPAAHIVETATVLAEVAAHTRKTMLASWMGGELMRPGEAILSEAKIPTFPYADTAARVFQRLWQYSTSLSGLYETPVFGTEIADTSSLAAELELKRGKLEPAMISKLLGAYGIDFDAAAMPTEIGFTLLSYLDQSFGPVMELSAAGFGKTVYEDSEAALPPLTSTLARRMLDQVRLHRACSSEALLGLEAVLVRFSRLVSEMAVVRALCIELVVEADGRIRVNAASGELQPAGLARADWPKCVIRPYPQQYVQALRLRNGSEAMMRPIRPEDEARIVDFHNDLSERSVYLRYLQFLKFEERILHERLARVCFNDYSRELALVVEQQGKILGVGRLQRNPLRMEEAEVAFLVRDTAQGQGIGTALVASITRAAGIEGLTMLTAELLADNKPMRSMLERAGFRIRLAMDGQTLLASLPLVEN